MTLRISKANYANLQAMADGKGLDLKAEIAACKEWKANRKVVIKDPYRTMLNWINKATPGRTVTSRDLEGGYTTPKTGPYEPKEFKRRQKALAAKAKTETDPEWQAWYANHKRLWANGVDAALAEMGMRRATEEERRTASD